MNIWALPKAMELRLLLLTLDQSVDIGRLKIDCAGESDHQAIHLCDSANKGLNAYLYTYGQSEGRYGLQLHYPMQQNGASSPYDPLEELTLEQVVEHLFVHFDLT